MESWIIPVRLIISFLLGAVIGLEREINEKKAQIPGEKPQAILGLRSFSLITSLGTIVGFLYSSYPALALLIGSAALVLFIIFYILDTYLTKDSGLTTEFAMIYSFVIGIIIALPVFPIQITIAISVVLILILSRKRKIKDIVEEIRHNELNAFIAFAIIALVILPFLPNTTYSFADSKGLVNFIASSGLPLDRIKNIELFNPFRLWFIVVIITGIDLIGYALERIIGQRKGWILTSIAGGFVSSTATTQSLSQQSKVAGGIHHLLAAALIANLVSFIQIAVLLSPVNPGFVVKLVPTFLALIGSSLLISLYFYRKKDNKKSTKTIREKQKNDRNLFEIGSALRFAGIYVLIGMASKIALEFFGSGAFLFTTAIGALAGLDAVMINTAQLVGSRIDISLAVWAFIIANAINLLGKSFYSYLQGKKEFALKFTVSMVIIIVSSLIGILFI